MTLAAWLWKRAHQLLQSSGSDRGCTACLGVIERSDQLLAFALAHAAVQSHVRIAALLAQKHEQVQRLQSGRMQDVMGV